MVFEHVNLLSKNGSACPPLLVAMQSLYEKDKMFALQYIACSSGAKTSYRSRDEEKKCEDSEGKKRLSKSVYAHFWPPDNVSTSILQG